MSRILLNTDYTAYFWVNSLYMNDKQFGIQTAHCISDMSQHVYGADIYSEWAQNHKTIIMFNGTNSGTIKRIFAILQYFARNMAKADILIPHTIFREDMESLDGATTACGFIIPNAIRQYNWDSYASHDDSIQWPMGFLPLLYAGDDLHEPGEIGLNSIMKRLSKRMLPIRLRLPLISLIIKAMFRGHMTNSALQSFRSG